MTTDKFKYMNPFKGSAGNMENLRQFGLATGCLNVNEGAV